jgi:hypothetical protein
MHGFVSLCEQASGRVMSGRPEPNRALWVTGVTFSAGFHALDLVSSMIQCYATQLSRKWTEVSNDVSSFFERVFS